MPSWPEKTLKYNPGKKSLKAPFAIYIDSECILRKVQSSQNNPEKSYTEKKARHEPSGWSMSIICSFDKKENKFNYCRRKDCMQKNKRNANEIINREKKLYHWPKKKLIVIINKKYVIYAKKSFV